MNGKDFLDDKGLLGRLAKQTADEMVEFRRRKPGATFEDWKRHSFWKDVPEMLIMIPIAIAIAFVLWLFSPFTLMYLLSR